MFPAHGRIKCIAQDFTHKMRVEIGDVGPDAPPTADTWRTCQDVLDVDFIVEEGGKDEAGTPTWKLAQVSQTTKPFRKNPVVKEFSSACAS